MQLVQSGDVFPGSLSRWCHCDRQFRWHAPGTSGAHSVCSGGGTKTGQRLRPCHVRTASAQLLRPAEPVFRLTPLPLKSRLAGALGVDFVSVVHFDATLAALTPERFVEDHLVKRLGVSHVISGYDFHFGKGRKGNPDTLRDLGKQHGFSVTVLDQVTDDNGLAPFSSSSIRGALHHGHSTAMQVMSRLLLDHTGRGRPWRPPRPADRLSYRQYHCRRRRRTIPRDLCGFRRRRRASRGAAEARCWIFRQTSDLRDQPDLPRSLPARLFKGDLYGKISSSSSSISSGLIPQIQSVAELVSQITHDCGEVRRRLPAGDAWKNLFPGLAYFSEPG